MRAILAFVAAAIITSLLFQLIDTRQADSRRQDIQAAVSILHGLFAEYEAECKIDSMLVLHSYASGMDTIFFLPEDTAGIKIQPTFKGFVEYLERKYPE